jgi:predicted PurR-regulated permease PerM
VIGETSARDVYACVCLAISLFSAPLVPFFLLVDLDHLAPRAVRELPGHSREMTRNAALAAVVLLMLLSPAPEATR